MHVGSGNTDLQGTYFGLSVWAIPAFLTTSVQHNAVLIFFFSNKFTPVPNMQANIDYSLK
jgi:hypothetical protein